MIHKIYIIHFLKADIKTIPLFLPTNKKYVKKTDIEIAKYFTVGISSIDETY